QRGSQNGWGIEGPPGDAVEDQEPYGDRGRAQSARDDAFLVDLCQLRGLRLRVSRDNDSRLIGHDALLSRPKAVEDSPSPPPRQAYTCPLEVSTLSHGQSDHHITRAFHRTAADCLYQGHQFAARRC